MGELHEYTLKGKSLKLKKAIIFFISCVIAYIISRIIPIIEEIVQISLWWIEIPSIVGVYTGIDKIIDKYFWSKFYGIPYLEGEWEGYIKSSFDNYVNKIPIIRCVIKQNSKMISIVFEMNQSKSYSINAIIDFSKINGITLEYKYINIPNIEENETLNVHFGENKFTIKDNELEGEYFNKQRATNGKIYLKKKEEI